MSSRTHAAFAAMLAVLVAFACPIASADVLEDNFDDGTLADWPAANVGGSTLTNPGSGGNPGGYLQSARDPHNTSFYMSEKYTGNLETLIGSTGVVISADLRIEDAGDVTTLRFELSNPTFSDIWRKDLHAAVSPLFPWDSSNGWVSVSYPIDLDWTDQEANDHGWFRVFPSGSPKSFADVVRDVKGNFSGFTMAGTSQLTSLDNFKIAPAVTGTNGDFDGDGIVDGTDFLWWQRGNSPTSLSPDDLQDWKDNFGVSATPATTAIPEPSALALLIVGALLLKGVRPALR